MRETLKNLKGIAQLHEGSKDFVQLALEYQQTSDNVILAYVFVELYPAIKNTTNKYFNITEEDKASFALQELDKALLNFDTTKEATSSKWFKMFYVTYLNRRLFAETNLLNADKRKANYVCNYFDMENNTINRGHMTEASSDYRDDIVSMYNEKNLQYKEDKFNELEISMTLSNLSGLTINELRYCEIIIRESATDVTDSEVARELNISPSAVFQLKKALRKKFLNTCFCE